MSTDTDSPQYPTDARLLYEYLGRKLDEGEQTQPAREVLADLEAYGAQLERLRAMVQEAEQSLLRGEARELDVDALLERVRQRAANEGAAS